MTISPATCLKLLCQSSLGMEREKDSILEGSGMDSELECVGVEVRRIE